MEGGCTCGQVRYRLIGTPLIVHACHCRWCQRETGTVHALNALYEADRVAHTAGEPEIVVTPSASGKGQKIARCLACRVAVWSNYPRDWRGQRQDGHSWRHWLTPGDGDRAIPRSRTIFGSACAMAAIPRSASMDVTGLASFA
jgi:Glutathione-dependent formaldehyde-activating enzyme